MFINCNMKLFNLLFCFQIQITTLCVSISLRNMSYHAVFDYADFDYAIFLLVLFMMLFFIMLFL